VKNPLSRFFVTRKNKQTTDKCLQKSERIKKRGEKKGESQISITRLISPIFIVKIYTFQFVYCSFFFQICIIPTAIAAKED
jgi:hypothetical protein